jgi:hypothetical protein
MIKTIVWDGKVERYSTENFSHQFEVERFYRGGYECHINFAGREVIARTGSNRIESIQNALSALQQSAYKLPFAEYRMEDILTGQF